MKQQKYNKNYFYKEPELVSNKKSENKISLNEYLSLYNRQRFLDNVIKKWFQRIDKTKPNKTKEEWDKILNKFHTETEK